MENEYRSNSGITLHKKYRTAKQVIEYVSHFNINYYELFNFDTLYDILEKYAEAERERDRKIGRFSCHLRTAKISPEFIKDVFHDNFTARVYCKLYKFIKFRQVNNSKLSSSYRIVYPKINTIFHDILIKFRDLGFYVQYAYEENCNEISLRVYC